MRHFLFLAGIIFVMCFQLSCGSDEEVEMIPEEVMDIKQDNYGLPIVSDAKLTSMYESEVRELEVNSELQLITVLDGIDKVSITVKYLGIRDFDLGFPIYEFELTDPIVEKIGGVAGGMSGSPVGPPGRVMGALAYGNSFAAPPYRFWATAIDAMEEARDLLPFGEFLEVAGAPSVHTRLMPIKTPLVVSGTNHRRVEYVSKLLKSSRFDAIDFVVDVGGKPASAPAASGELEAGDMIGAAVATGDVVNLIGYGTVTQVYDDGTFVAFGHSFRYDGAIAMPVYRATTSGIIANFQRPSKSVVAYGEPVGTLTKDFSAAVVGVIGEAPDTIPVTVSYHPVNSDDPIKTTSEVAYGQEWAIAPVVAWTADALRREYTHGTSDGKVVLTFEETKETYTQMWRNVSSDPFFDTYENIDYAVDEFTDPLKNAAGKATLKSVSVEIMDRAQIASAEIIDVKFPDNISSGTQVVFTVVLLPHWSVVEGDDRTIEKDISINIPSDFGSGSVTLEVEAESVDLFDLIFDFDFDFDFDNDAEEEGPPQTLEELISERQEKLSVPGTIKITLESDESSDDVEEELVFEDLVVTGEFIDIIFLE